MTTSDTQHDYPRFRFENDSLVPRPALELDCLGVTKNKSDLQRYLKGFGSYLHRLTNSDNGGRTECPFCDFDLNLNQETYDTGNKDEVLVSTLETHKNLWKNGYILTYNPSGWHLINEIFLPRKHKQMVEFLENDLRSIIEQGQSRWRRHRTGLEESPFDANYYHGIVSNVKYGQSIQHAHIHYYTSSHDRKDYVDARTLLKKVKTEGGIAKIYVVPFDHPRLEIKLEKVSDFPQIGSQIFRIGKSVYKGLFGTDLPLSIGWFSDTTRGKEVILHPMQRRGTIQEFQKSTFHQFSSSEVVRTFEPILEETIRDYSEVEIVNE